LVPASFHGKIIQPDAETLKKLKKITEKTSIMKNQIITHASQMIVHAKMEESFLGNMLADAIQEATGADFAYINSGSLRTSLEPGPVTYGDLFRAYPFNNRIVTFPITSEELRLFLQVAESGSRGFGSLAGLQVRLLSPRYEANFIDFNGDHTFAPWKLNRLLDVTLADKTPLTPHKQYQLATIDFLVTGGDDLKWVMQHLNMEKRMHDTGIHSQEAFLRYLKKIKNLQPSERRIQFEGPEQPHPLKKRHKKNHEKRFSHDTKKNRILFEKKQERHSHKTFEKSHKNLSFFTKKCMLRTILHDQQSC
jgi:2',3'-cyclic-nucleotide 2'-phosphodiesterase (5'-nucleotidase family)